METLRGHTAGQETAGRWTNAGTLHDKTPDEHLNMHRLTGKIQDETGEAGRARMPLELGGAQMPLDTGRELWETGGAQLGQGWIQQGSHWEQMNEQ